MALSGMDRMLHSVLQYFGLDPEKTRADLASWGQIMADAQLRSIRIERKLNRLLDQAGINYVDIDAEGQRLGAVIDGQTVNGGGTGGIASGDDAARGNHGVHGAVS